MLLVAVAVLVLLVALAYQTLLEGQAAMVLLLQFLVHPLLMLAVEVAAHMAQSRNLLVVQAVVVKVVLLILLVLMVLLILAVAVVVAVQAEGQALAVQAL
jgi:hypothetical protein